MFRIAPRAFTPWALPALLALTLSLLTACSSAPGSKCFAKAVPSSGEGALAWDNDVNAASAKSVQACRRYASRSGGTPGTCKVTVAQCK